MKHTLNILTVVAVAVGLICIMPGCGLLTNDSSLGGANTLGDNIETGGGGDELPGPGPIQGEGDQLTVTKLVEDLHDGLSQTIIQDVLESFGMIFSDAAFNPSSSILKVLWGKGPDDPPPPLECNNNGECDPGETTVSCSRDCFNFCTDVCGENEEILCRLPGVCIIIDPKGVEGKVCDPELIQGACYCTAPDLDGACDDLPPPPPIPPPLEIILPNVLNIAEGDVREITISKQDGALEGIIVFTRDTKAEGDTINGVARLTFDDYVVKGTYLINGAANGTVTIRATTDTQMYVVINLEDASDDGSGIIVSLVPGSALAAKAVVDDADVYARIIEILTSMNMLHDGGTGILSVTRDKSSATIVQGDTTHQCGADTCEVDDGSGEGPVCNNDGVCDPDEAIGYCADCDPAGLEHCHNDMDDNGDGVTDCADSQCKSTFYCILLGDNAESLRPCHLGKNDWVFHEQAKEGDLEKGDELMALLDLPTNPVFDHNAKAMRPLGCDAYLTYMLDEVVGECKAEGDPEIAVFDCVGWYSDGSVCEPIFAGPPPKPGEDPAPSPLPDYVGVCSTGGGEGPGLTCDPNTNLVTVDWAAIDIDYEGEATCEEIGFSNCTTVSTPDGDVSTCGDENCLVTSCFTAYLILVSANKQPLAPVCGDEYCDAISQDPKGDTECITCGLDCLESEACLEPLGCGDGYCDLATECGSCSDCDNFPQCGGDPCKTFSASFACKDLFQDYEGEVGTRIACCAPAASVCGNDICEPDEDPEICPEDCALPGCLEVTCVFLDPKDPRAPPIVDEQACIDAGCEVCQTDDKAPGYGFCTELLLPECFELPCNPEDPKDTTCIENGCGDCVDVSDPKSEIPIYACSDAAPPAGCESVMDCIEDPGYDCIGGECVALGCDPGMPSCAQAVAMFGSCEAFGDLIEMPLTCDDPCCVPTGGPPPPPAGCESVMNCMEGLGQDCIDGECVQVCDPMTEMPSCAQAVAMFGSCEAMGPLICDDPCCAPAGPPPACVDIPCGGAGFDPDCDAAGCGDCVNMAPPPPAIPVYVCSEPLLGCVAIECAVLGERGAIIEIPDACVDCGDCVTNPVDPAFGFCTDPPPPPPACEIISCLDALDVGGCAAGGLKCDNPGFDPVGDPTGCCVPPPR